MKGIVILLATLGLINGCGDGDGAADALCKKRLSNDSAIHECKSALKEYCEAPELATLNACDQNNLSKDCLDKIRDVSNKCRESLQTVKSCARAKDESRLKQDISVGKCVRDTQIACTNISSAISCLKGDKSFCTEFFLKSETCSSALKAMLVNFSPGSEIRNSCEKAAKERLLVAGTSVDTCETELSKVCTSTKDKRAVESCVRNVKFCSEFFIGDVKTACKERIEKYFVGAGR